MNKKAKKIPDIDLDINTDVIKLSSKKKIDEEDNVEGRGTSQRVYINIYNETSENFFLASGQSPEQGKWEIAPLQILYAGDKIRVINVGVGFTGPKGQLNYRTFGDEFCNISWHWTHQNKFTRNINVGPAPLYHEDSQDISALDYITLSVYIRSK